MAGEKGELGKAGGRIIEKAMAGKVERAATLGVKAGEDAGAKAAGDTAKTVGADLSRSEREALGNYIGTKSLRWGEKKPYEVVNAMERGAPIDEAYRDAATRTSDDLSSALGKLPDHEGRVYRGTNLPEDIKAKYVPGETVTEDAFTSTSKTPKGSFGGNTQYVIDSKHGKSIRGFGLNHDFDKQDEVLFDKGTRFHVVDVRDVGGGGRSRTRIILREL